LKRLRVLRGNNALWFLRWTGYSLPPEQIPALAPLLQAEALASLPAEDWESVDTQIGLQTGEFFTGDPVFDAMVADMLSGDDSDDGDELTQRVQSSVVSELRRLRDQAGGGRG
jgi:hypothetical protein